MITAALLSANCFMQVPEAKGHINIELDKVLGFFFFLFVFYTPPPPLLSSNIPRSAGSKQTQSTYFKKLQLPSDRSAKRFSFNINQQTCRAETCWRVSLPQKCLHPGINLKFKFAAKAVFVAINNQIFEPFFALLYLVPTIPLSKQNMRMFPLLDVTQLFAATPTFKDKEVRKIWIEA